MRIASSLGRETTIQFKDCSCKLREGSHEDHNIHSTCI